MPYVVTAVFGLAFGSFLNVCIFRLPRHESVVTPRSRCPHCGRPVRWYDNIPVFSYALLGGRCRDCRQQISPTYPLVEILTAAVLVVAFAKYGPSPQFIKYALLDMLLLTVLFTDLNDRIIPLPITLFGIGVGILLSFVIPVEDQPLDWLLRRWDIYLDFPISSLAGAVSGALFGAGFFYLAVATLKFVAKTFHMKLPQELLGFGDVMLILLVGTFVGVPLSFLTMFLASLFGCIISLTLHVASSRFRNHYHWPFGTFLAGAAIYASFWGNVLLEQYLRWSGFGP